MEIILFIGVAIFIIGGIGLLIAAFKTSVWWGLGCLFISPVALIYVIVHWGTAKNPFLLQLLGLGVMLVGGLLGGQI